MTQEQKDIFIDITSMGLACGLDTPTEWLMNYLMHISQLEVYHEIAEKEKKAVNAFAQMYRESPSQPEDPFEKMTDEDFKEYVSYPYNKKMAELDANRQGDKSE